MCKVACCCALSAEKDDVSEIANSPLLFAYLRTLKNPDYFSQYQSRHPL